ncbi:hypothetical protein DFH09DRAFT_1327956 [Mycena vulgaris]|nr:hypothetical protein DFH09DRAFT_1327956 [Mycena vulgaris]
MLLTTPRLPAHHRLPATARPLLVTAAAEQLIPPAHTCCCLPHTLVAARRTCLPALAAHIWYCPCRRMCPPHALSTAQAHALVTPCGTCSLQPMPHTHCSPLHALVTAVLAATLCSREEDEEELAQWQEDDERLPSITKGEKGEEDRQDITGWDKKGYKDRLLNQFVRFLVAAEPPAHPSSVTEAKDVPTTSQNVPTITQHGSPPAPAIQNQNQNNPATTQCGSQPESGIQNQNQNMHASQEPNVPTPQNQNALAPPLQSQNAPAGRDTEVPTCLITPNPLEVRCDKEDRSATGVNGMVFSW